MRQIFRVKAIPLPEARIGGVHSGTMKRHVLRVQDGIIAVLDNFGFEAKVAVMEYALIILQPDGNCRRFFTVSGPRFTDEMRDALDSIAAGDLVLATGIRAKFPDGETRSLDPVQITVVD